MCFKEGNVMEKEKSIETEQLLIKGNIMSWEDTMIQLSNVSFISTSPLEPLKFPRIILLTLIASFVMMKFNAGIGVLLLMVCMGWSYFWYDENQSRDSKKVLKIVMNSGYSLCIIFANQSFLQTVLQVLKQIFIEGGVGEQNVMIDLRNAKISGNANVLNHLIASQGRNI